MSASYELSHTQVRIRRDLWERMKVEAEMRMLGPSRLLDLIVEGALDSMRPVEQLNWDEMEQK